eukprot:TRINITY_DN8572_c0_g2_i1.p1 TRINITY_DN8572_c0_g2~~TRINITY_DN8572_c0_g2_i1.p1  ORF type:complete len:382 (-),score=103.26 TRINITY_DN8572_c0_g2_i1:312-1457(-)
MDPQSKVVDEPPPRVESDEQQLQQEESTSCCSCFALPVPEAAVRAPQATSLIIRALPAQECAPGKQLSIALIDKLERFHHPKSMAIPVGSPESPVREARPSLLSEEILHNRRYFGKVRNKPQDLAKSFPTKICLRSVCRRFRAIADSDRQLLQDRVVNNVKSEVYTAFKHEQQDRQAHKNEVRGNRGKWTMQALVAVNVLFGFALLVIGASGWDDSCDYPFAKLLLTCGVANICMVSVYLLICVDQSVLWPMDEDEDEEMGWPLHVAGLVIWLCWIVDFTSWIILCMVYRKSSVCDSTLEGAALATVIIRAALIAIQLLLIVAHLRNKIRAENKRKWGGNPFKMGKKSKYLGYDEAQATEDREVEAELQAMGYYNQPGEDL